MKTELIEKAYAIAKERYAAIGVDTDRALEILKHTPISLHCWQADDVTGFERGEALSGGIQATGNYPGKARNIDELRQDIVKVKSLIGGTYRFNLHETYGEFGGKQVDRNEVETKYFQGWIDWAKSIGMKLDFNSTSFSHPKSGYLSLSNPDKSIRDFWIEHTKRCRRIANDMGKAQNDPCIMNIWVHDGLKDITVERLRYRKLLKASLDEILTENLPDMKTCLEAKLFGIGMESYTVGSHDFYAGYCSKNNVMYTLDTGHYEPTENVSDMISSLLLYVPELMLHVSRPVHWDSDHVTIMNDQTLDLFKELVRADALNRAHIGLDYFDASINRIGAYVIGIRATQKSLLAALLEPLDMLRQYEDDDKGFERLALLEEAKTLPIGAVYDYFNMTNNVPVGEDFIADVERYEVDVLSKR
ncbi:putative L-rhamnose isomerase [Hoylesella oralis ATCC 33269]|uniref:L-rhamnose isomerase n=1 Tax=Hoylesella oralis ATCC 33269 TaxID=873533 RepID=E7RQT9_9BACT|nr:L-rhamnose isomerase [Hoylesella oralis]EFZ36627.1 putative L-rhamnose isomerase [Hoylesella oralis ATCC 33269]EPH18392.1 L-rhamnose isomerase [Hoylesella oralis HGA0225]SHG10175.1 L-rhamnose isomerase [Hoylesella oralis]